MTIRIDWQDSVATISFDRPQALNALGPELITGAAQALRRTLADERARAIVITGVGRAFSAGGDVAWFDELQRRGPDAALEEIPRFMQTMGNPFVEMIAGARVPIVAAVNGPCVGGAVGVALAADVVIAARSAYFLLPQVPSLGVVPDLGASWAVPRVAGRARALGMALLGDRIDAEQAERWGLIWKCVDDAALLSDAAAIAARLAHAPSEAIVATRRLIDAAPGTTLADQLAQERECQRERVGSPFFREACARFVAASKARKG